MVSEKEFLDIYFRNSGYGSAEFKNIGTHIKGMLIYKMKLYKSLTSLVNYHCRNGCTAHGINKCCCGYCEENVGYLSHISYEDIPIYAKSFGKNGFWTDCGCILPRELRSCICLTQNCHPDKLKSAEHNLISIIKNGYDAIKSYKDMNYATGDVLDHLKKRLMEENNDISM